MRRCRRGPTGPAAGTLAVLALLACAPPCHGQQLSPEESALLVLSTAGRAYNQAQYPLAAERFREFLKTYPAHKDAVWANYGLALSLLELPEKDYKSAAECLQQVAGRNDFADRPLALYYLAVAQRGLGNQLLAQALAKPGEAANIRQAAAAQFDEAGRNFAAAAAAFAARVRAPATSSGPSAQVLPTEAEWMARARCDQCEMLLEVGKFKEAADVSEGVLAITRSQYRPLALYQLGCARFGLRDYLSAGKALSQLAPFAQEFGLHARYLLARVHHLSNDRAEAAAQYKAVPADYEARKKAAQQALANPAALTGEQRAYHQGLINNPPPDFLLRSSFYMGLLQAEEARYAEALATLTGVIQANPKSPLVPEAQLRVGFCQLQQKSFAEAVKVLTPLAEHPLLADQALWWLGRAQAGQADPANPAAYQQVLAASLQTLARAAAKAAELAGKGDVDAKLRRADILLELGDTQQLAKQYKEAAATYQQVISENAAGDRNEQAMQRQLTALHLTGQYARSDQLCQSFEKTYPKSTLLPAVLFRYAENQYLSAVAPPAAPPPDQLKAMLSEAVSRYQRLLKQYPEFACVNQARQGLATAHYRLGHYTEAAAVLSAIPEADRNGELASVSYLLADCLIRTLPKEGDDAVQAAKHVEQVEQAAKLLEAYLSALAPPPPAPSKEPNPQAVDALLKLGYCYSRIGLVLADPAERQKYFTQARAACERALRQFPSDPSLPAVVFERAKCLLLLDDAGTAANELARFRAEPLKSSPVAPLAAVRLASLYRSGNRPAEAVAVMNESRTAHEAALLKDPARADWVPLMQYEHALALKESGKLPEARTMFEAMASQFAGRPEAANALWRAGQCRREEVLAALTAARAATNKPGAKPDQIAAANQAVAAQLASLRQTIEGLQGQAAELAKTSPGAPGHLRLLYELAWCHRTLGSAEVDAAKAPLQKQALEKVLAGIARQLAPGEAAPALAPPEVPTPAIALQPAEKAARDAYQKLIAAGAETALANQGRFELAEVMALRAAGPDDYTPAMTLLAETLEKNPAPELAERIKLRLAACLLAKGQPKLALANAQAVLKHPATPLQGEARYLAGEAYLQLKDYPKAIVQLALLRDQGPLQNIPRVSDRALLRLGFVYAQSGQWELSRQALEILAQRFGQSPWLDEARFGIGLAWQALKQPDSAVAAFTEVTRRTAGELAAKAQLQIGLCRLEQQRYPEAAKALITVPMTYDYPELAAAAWCEAGRAYLESSQPAEAAKLFQRVIDDYPASDWAKTARQRLAGMK